MKKDKFFENKVIFFVGVGGISMSGLCKLAQFWGAKVMGSDIKENDETIKLKGLGIDIKIGHDAKNINKNIDLVVYSGAIKKDNIELQTAKKLHIKCMERSKFLGIISRLYDQVIAISGTHGKTTTTAIISEICVLAGLNPTIHLGGESVNLDSNTIIGSRKILILEACEYRESFKYLKPDILVITNIECDHMDYYKSLKDIIHAFVRLSKRAKIVISKENIKNVKYLIGKDFDVSNVKFENCGYTFDVKDTNNYIDTYSLNVLGKHNVYNATFSIIVCKILGVSDDIIKLGINNFLGVKRRYEKIGNIGNVPVIIDYAHHPTEIATSIDGIKEVYKNLLVVFQPHTYSRTLTLMKEFKKAFIDVNKLIIYTTYPAREKEIVGGRAIDLFNELNKCDCPNCMNLCTRNSDKILLYSDSIEDLQQKILDTIKENNIETILILGAGDLAEKIKGVMQK